MTKWRLHEKCTRVQLRSYTVTRSRDRWRTLTSNTWYETRPIPRILKRGISTCMVLRLLWMTEARNLETGVGGGVMLGGVTEPSRLTTLPRYRDWKKWEGGREKWEGERKKWEEGTKEVRGDERSERGNERSERGNEREVKGTGSGIRFRWLKD